MDPIHLKDMSNDLLINCILVDNQVRTAFLIQPADYKEAMSTDTKSAIKIRAIKSIFPNLFLSNIRGETIVSKEHKYVEEDITSDAEMGKIIGYPCADEFKLVLEIADTKQTVIIEINAYLDNGDKVNILAYVCLDDKHFKKAQELAEKAEHVLKKFSLVDGAKVINVKAEKRMSIPVASLIEKLISGTEELSDEEISEIDNEIYNLGFEKFKEFNPDYSNPIHRGMVIALLLFCKNDPSSPFYPLQYRPEWRAVEEKTKLLENDLIDAFKST